MDLLLEIDDLGIWELIVGIFRHGWNLIDMTDIFESFDRFRLSRIGIVEDIGNGLAAIEWLGMAGVLVPCFKVCQRGFCSQREMSENLFFLVNLIDHLRWFWVLLVSFLLELQDLLPQFFVFLLQIPNRLCVHIVADLVGLGSLLELFCFFREQSKPLSVGLDFSLNLPEPVFLVELLFRHLFRGGLLLDEWDIVL